MFPPSPTPPTLYHLRNIKFHDQVLGCLWCCLFFVFTGSQSNEQTSYPDGATTRRRSNWKLHAATSRRPAAAFLDDNRLKLKLCDAIKHGLIFRRDFQLSVNISFLEIFLEGSFEKPCDAIGHRLTFRRDVQLPVQGSF